MIKFRIFGFDVVIQWSYWLIFIVLLIEMSHYDFSLANLFIILLLMVSLFISVLGHELSHSLVAKRLGIDTRIISINAMGGYMITNSMPSQRQMLLIASAGPIFNLALSFDISALLYIVGIFNINLGIFYKVAVFSVVLNLFQALLNALPASPLDGGRILQALLHEIFDNETVRRISIIVSHICAALIVTLGIVTHYHIVMIISLIIWLTIWIENRRS